MRFDDVAARLRSLPDPLPAPAGLLRAVATDGRDRLVPREPPADRPGRPAAVLVLVFPDPVGDARVVLIERTSGGRHHAGEVSFPGGRAEPDDADVVATAIREASEEVGLDIVSAGVDVLGTLEAFWIPVSDFAVTPVLAVASSTPRLVAAPTEVVRVLRPSIDGFLPGAPVDIVEATVRGWPLRYGAYPVDGLAVWGATARILSQLGAVAAGR